MTSQNSGGFRLHVLNPGGVVLLYGSQLLPNGADVAQNFNCEGLSLIMPKLLHGGNCLLQKRLQLGPAGFGGGFRCAT